MSKDYKMTQCFMMDQHCHTYVAWIPSKLAKVDQKIHFDDYMPKSTWIVMETYATKDYSWVNEYSQAYKNSFPSIEDQ